MMCLTSSPSRVKSGWFFYVQKLAIVSSDEKNGLDSPLTR
jgi:hypothetical protein